MVAVNFFVYFFTCPDSKVRAHEIASLSCLGDKKVNRNTWECYENRPFAVEKRGKKQVYWKFMRLISCECNKTNDLSRINPDFYRDKPNELTILLFAGGKELLCVSPGLI